MVRKMLKFEWWLKNLLRWYHINRYYGMEHDEDHVSCMALFLQGDALHWYDDNVDGINHWKDVWLFMTVITGLYDCFIHNVALTEASDKFGQAKYIAGEGVMAFYYRLVRYAEQMVRSPNRYIFKKHYIMWLLKGIFDYLLSKEITAEHSKMEAILHHARKAEKGINQTATWYDTRHIIRAEILAQRTENIPKRYLNQWETLAQEVERNPERNPNWCEYMPKRKETNDSKNKELLKKVVCFRCGQTGHMVKSEPDEGSQYSSEGEEMWFEDEFQEKEGEVQMHTYRTKEFEEDPEEIEELDEDNWPTEESSDDEDIIENSKSDLEDREDDDPIQEFLTRESELHLQKEEERTINFVTTSGKTLLSSGHSHSPWIFSGNLTVVIWGQVTLTGKNWNQTKLDWSWLNFRSWSGGSNWCCSQGRITFRHKEELVRTGQNWSWPDQSQPLSSALAFKRGPLHSNTVLLYSANYEHLRDIGDINMGRYL